MGRLTPRGLTTCIGRLSLMVYFPADGPSRAALAEELKRMVTYNEEAEWLAHRANQVFSNWPGVRELRALFCKRFRPKDGVEVDSKIFPEGFPSEAELGPVPVAGLLPSLTEREALEAARLPLLSGPVSEDPEALAIVSSLVQSAGLVQSASSIDPETGCTVAELREESR
jgi:hypothetical protein